MTSVDQPLQARRSTTRVATWLAVRPWRNAIMAGVGGALATGALALANVATVLPLLIPPFGASCVLVFAAPASPFARARNVIGGHLVSAAVGLLMVALFGSGPLGLALGVGLAIAAMVLSDTVHPPAGANPVVVALLNPGFFLAPILIGATTIVVLGLAYNHLRSRIKI